MGVAGLIGGLRTLLRRLSGENRRAWLDVVDTPNRVDERAQRVPCWDRPVDLALNLHPLIERWAADQQQGFWTGRIPGPPQGAGEPPGMACKGRASTRVAGKGY